jgi:hypothetical protein
LGCIWGAVLLGSLACFVLALTIGFIDSSLQGIFGGVGFYGLLLSALLALIDGYLTRLAKRRSRRQALVNLKASAFPDRAQRAFAALQEATELVEEIRAELDARMALLQGVRDQLEQTTREVDNMRVLANADPETLRIANQYFDAALENRLGSLEGRARKREIFLATIVGLLVGVVAIAVAHYMLSIG